MTQPQNIIGADGQVRKELPHEVHFRLLRDWLEKAYRRPEHDACVEFVAAGVRCDAGDVSKVRGRSQDQVATLFLKDGIALSPRFASSTITMRLFESYVTSGLLSPDSIACDVGRAPNTAGSRDYDTRRDRSALEAAIYHRLYGVAALMVDRGFLEHTDARESLKQMLSTYRDEVGELGCSALLGDESRVTTPAVAFEGLAEVTAELNGEEEGPEYARLREALVRHHARAKLMASEPAEQSVEGASKPRRAKP